MTVDLKKKVRRIAVAIAILAALPIALQSQERDRSKIADHYKWDLTALYPSDQVWRSGKDTVAAEIPKLREFQGTLATSAKRLADALETRSRLERDLNRLYVYASLISDQDIRVSAYLGMKQEMVQLASTFGTESAYLEPEILTIDSLTTA